MLLVFVCRVPRARRDVAVAGDDGGPLATLSRELVELVKLVVKALEER
jgi:hypothetical protein